ncbi:MAG TPA: pyridoxal-phosphate dependent enzyme [Steroidobacteraceae bacterium]|nr:pyridoxal-phosphate dependent enzyme [Steroidobacteraceae bacterium]
MPGVPDADSGTPNLSLADIRAARARLGARIRTTPVQPLAGPAVAAALPPGTQATLKLELFQHTGSFKARGALVNVLSLTEAERERGICAISAGNHAIAAAFAAQAIGTSAKIVMKEGANAFRVAECRRYGGEIVFEPEFAAAFRRVERIRDEEGRRLVHPFEGLLTAQGTGTLGLEFIEQAPDLEAVIVPVGGGGLAAGLATAIRLMKPDCRVYGVEPFGADTMYRSFAAGSPQSIDRIDTIADSLGSPYAMPVSYALCRASIEEIVRVEDAEMVRAMRFLLEHARLAVEPAGAAATAALLGPLRERLAGRRVGLIVCGSNIAADAYARLIAG